MFSKPNHGHLRLLTTAREAGMSEGVEPRRWRFWRECCCVACGRSDDKQRGGPAGAVGTSGRAGNGAMTRRRRARTRRAAGLRHPRRRGRAAVGAHQTVLSETRRRPRVDRRTGSPAADGRADRGAAAGRSRRARPALYNTVDAGGAPRGSGPRLPVDEGLQRDRGRGARRLADLSLPADTRRTLPTASSDLSHADPNWKIRDKKADPLALLEQALEQEPGRASRSRSSTPHASRSTRGSATRSRSTARSRSAAAGRRCPRS